LIAGQIFRKGRGSVPFLSYRKLLYDKKQKKVLFKAAEGFGFGMGDGNGVCGAVVGAAIVCGLQNIAGNLDSPRQSRPATRELVLKIKEGFQEKYGSVICSQVLGEGGKGAKRPCRECVADAAELVEKFI